MYIFFGLILLFLILFCCVNHFRKKKIIQKITCTPLEEKCREINELIEPFGYFYSPEKDIFSTRTDAWQRTFGYCSLYDKAAYHFNMNFDCLPVYFNYKNRTWLIEFWKGQYGINTGGEIGIYYADRILEEDEYTSTLFDCVSDEDMLNLSLTLIKNDEPIAKLHDRHWWLTAFSLGCFSQPRELSLYAYLCFPDREMANAFAEGLLRAGYSSLSFQNNHTVTFRFTHSFAPTGFFRKLRTFIGQWSNLFFCKVYLFTTRPFHSSVDRLLYLSYYVPFAFRKTLRIRRYRKFRTRKK